MAGLDHPVKVLMCGSDQPEIALQLPLASHGPEAVLLEDPQEGLLDDCGSSPTSSRKSVPPWACLTGRPGPFGAGEGALLVAEQGGFDESRRQGRAVDDDEVLTDARGVFSWMARAKSSFPCPSRP